MGNLPSSRVTVQFPFAEVGVDFCGPFQIKPMIRSRVLIKAYIAVFVCFTTKAIHLELVLDLTTDSFIAALKRFISTRGKPNTIHSDNATNFVGANLKLKKLREEFIQKSNFDTAMNECSIQDINWKFIPPGSPHFGGLWEAGVKSVKGHLYKILKNTTITQEQLNTLLIEIEATLNSRPLSICSDDPNDLQPLTPNHFLIGRSLQSIPEVQLTSVKQNQLKKWQICQQLYEHFWNRWSIEYLHHLQQKWKWHNENNELKVNQIVLLKQDNIPPRMWTLGKITELFRGSDNLVRVVTIRTSHGNYKRAINKICPLPCVS